MRVLQRGLRFELIVRATSMNDNSKSKMTTEDFEDCDNSENECSSSQISIATDGAVIKFPLFQDQTPQIISRVKPKSLDVTNKLSSVSMDTCLDNDKWETVSKGKRFTKMFTSMSL